METQNCHAVFTVPFVGLIDKDILLYYRCGQNASVLMRKNSFPNWYKSINLLLVNKLNDFLKFLYILIAVI